MPFKRQRFALGISLQIIGYAFGSAGAAILVVCALLSLWVGALCGLVLLLVGAWFGLRGEDLEQ